MPTYEYECRQCGHTFEAFQSMSDAPLASCPRCKGKVRRLIGGGMAVIFKGSGFYTTDYKKSSVLTGGNGSKDSKDGSKDGSNAASKAGSEKPAASAAEKKPVS